MWIIGMVAMLSVKVSAIAAVALDNINCGYDPDIQVQVGAVSLETYPWLGLLYYQYRGEVGEERASTPIALIQSEFAVAAAADIGPMPKHNFRANSRVLFGVSWNEEGQRVRNYVLHPEYDETDNTIALIQLKDPVFRFTKTKPLCPPPELLRNPQFYIVRFKDDYNKLEKEIIPADHVPASLCKEFYEAANLYEKRMRPPHATCAVALDTEKVCTWEAGAALVTKDVWGRWQLLGLGVRGPGCGAPSRYLDIMSYQPWIEKSLSEFRRLTITRISGQKYVLRSSDYAYQRFGACDEEEKINLIYRDSIVLRTDHGQYQFLTYNMSIRQNIQYSCLTMELVNASAASEMRITHTCPRYNYGPACYSYKGTIFEISVYIVFAEKCSFELMAWGAKKNMTLLDIQEWKWEEGTYYQDFSLTKVEYRGQTQKTLFGFEPLDFRIWIADYDIWATTEFDNSSWSSTTPLPDQSAFDTNKNPTNLNAYYLYKATTTTSKYKYTKRTFKKKFTAATTTPTTKRKWPGIFPG